MIGVLSAAIVLALSLLEPQIAGSATMFTGGYLHVGVAIGWIICAGLIALVVTRHLKTVANAEEGAGLAVAYDALPILLLAAWVVMIAASATRTLVARRGRCSVEPLSRVDRRSPNVRGSRPTVGEKGSDTRGRRGQRVHRQQDARCRRSATRDDLGRGRHRGRVDGGVHARRSTTSAATRHTRTGSVIPMITVTTQ